MKDIYELFKITELNKYDKYHQMFKSSNINMSLLLPDYLVDDYEQSLLNAKSLLEKKDYKKYSKKIINHLSLLENIQRAKINVLYYKTITNIEKNPTILSTLKSFSPAGGFSKVANYDLFKTITGRIVNTEDSPKILTLPGRCRKIFESKWGKEGELISLDFKTLEPRVARKLNNKSTPEDIYNEISDGLESNIDRSIIKKAVISILYGSEAPLKELSAERSSLLLSTVKNYFELDNLLKLAENSNKFGYRENFFGRPLHNTNETNNNKIINNFIQSTAVDISLDYFSSLVKEINIDLCRPLFIIHDAIIFDVHNDYFSEIKKLAEKGYCCTDLGYFPIELTNLIKE